MSNIAAEQQETIIPFIKICRKLEGCSSFQLSQWIAKFPKIFDDNNCSDLFAKILIKGIFHFNKIIPMSVFESIESSSPNEKELNINDSITKSDRKKKKKKNNDKILQKKESLTLLKIPKDLKMLAFNFLRFKDLCSLQKTCRCLSITARNPNSLYHLSIYSQSNNYLHPFFSRIKSLHVNLWHGKQLFNQKWYHTVNCLTFHNVEDHESINKFVNVREYELSMNTGLLINNKINYKTLKRLTIRSCTFDDKLLFVLRKCINLEKLQLTCLKTNSFESIINNKCIMSIFADKKLNPFKKLNHFVIDHRMFKLPALIHWILCNNNCHKTLNIRPCRLDDSYDISNLFIKTSKLALLALQNIKHIIIGDLGGRSCSFSDHLYSSLNNMYESLQTINQNKEFRPFRFDTFDLILNSSPRGRINQQKLDLTQSFIPYCDECNLFLDINIHPQDDVIDLDLSELISNITSGNSKCFNVLQINIYFAVFYCRRIYKNISNTNKLKEIAKEIAILLLNGYNKWIKPFLCISKDKMKKIGMKSIKIKFGSGYFDDDHDDLLHDDSPINYSDDESYEKACEKRHAIIYKEWMKTIYPSLEQLLTNKFSNLCDVDMTADGCYVTLKLT